MIRINDKLLNKKYKNSKMILQIADELIFEIAEKDLNIILEDSDLGNLVWNVMGSTLLYAADLIPEIADDILNIDRAMRWGFAWQMGPFEIIDKLGPKNVIKKCLDKNQELPKMLQVLEKSGNEFFYNENMYLDLDGIYKEISN